jgi:hypothetical protein
MDGFSRQEVASGEADRWAFERLRDTADYWPFPREVWMVHGRNIRFGVWTGESWIGIREKFGSLFLDDCEVPGHTCFPVRYVDRLPGEIQMRCTFDPVCQHCDEPVDFDRERETRWQHTSAIDCGHRVMPIAKRYQPLFDYLTKIEETHEWAPT